MAKKNERRAKLDALKESGTLNPHPDAVADELFRQNNFFDPYDLMQVKYEMLRRVNVDSWSVSQAAQVFGFSRPSFYMARSEFGRIGLTGFIPKPKGPQTGHKLSSTVLSFFEKCRRDDPSIRTPDLVRLAKEEFGIDVHKRSIERAVNRSKKKLKN